MSALVRYQLELLLRSHGWLPSFLGYALLMVVGVSAGDPLLGALGFGAPVLLPVTAWYVRCAVTAEPPAARACRVAAAGAARVQVAGLLAALTAGLLLAAAGAAAIWLVSGPVGNPGAPGVPVGAALVAGLLVSVVCVLLGLAVGALCSRPVLPRAQYGVLLVPGVSVLVLVVAGSPANTAVRLLVEGARTGRVGFPWVELPVACAVALLAAAGSARLAGRRTG